MAAQNLSEKLLALFGKNGNQYIPDAVTCSKSYTKDKMVVHDYTNACKIKAGNGGDWEWFNDVNHWINWIKREMSVDNSQFDVYCNDFCYADEAWVTFNDPSMTLLFAMKAPKYVP